MNRIVINIPNNSPANLVNLFKAAAALNIAMRNNMTAVQMQTLSVDKNGKQWNKYRGTIWRNWKTITRSNSYLFIIPYHPAHARNNRSPRFGWFLAKLYRYVYIIIVGSATPTISSGCPPSTECMMPHIAVDANVSTVVSVPSETRQKLIFIFQCLRTRIHDYILLIFVKCHMER